MHTIAASKMRPWRLLLNSDYRQDVLASIHEIEGALVTHLKADEIPSTRDVDLSEGTWIES